ncbi:hypothetical protein BASA62_002817 [Batrachochytrium salamandrivorans]|nr:hypothetical protein BASA62_002817 [Batrachochytrium salamandrivorans]
MSTLTDLRALPNVALTNKPLFFSFISFDISVTTLLSQYRIARRDNTGRLRQSQQANELQQEVNALRTELDFLIQTQRSLTQQPTLQASLSPASCFPKLHTTTLPTSKRHAQVQKTHGGSTINSTRLHIGLREEAKGRLLPNGKIR